MVAYKRKIDLEKFKKIKMMESYRVHPFNKKLLYWIAHFMDPVEDNPKNGNFTSNKNSNALSTNFDNPLRPEEQHPNTE